MCPFVFYKPAGISDFVAMSGTVCEPVPRCNPLRQHFVVSSFDGTKVFIEVTSSVTCNINDLNISSLSPWLVKDGMPSADDESAYINVFGKFHDALCDGSFQKLVLSRCKWLEGRVDWQATFLNACRLYPDQSVVLFSTAETGTWLIVTPELLLHMDDSAGETMALAATKTSNRPWSDKEVREQSLVADYIEQRLKTVSQSVVRHEAEDVKAGSLTHICTRFEWQVHHCNPCVDDDYCLKVADTLHPTPAVCGLPAPEARHFILTNEGYDRSFYSGYCGLVDGAKCHLMVTLRCMQLTENGYYLYAGGGLLPASDAFSEFQETENKMKTIEKCIQISSL